MYNYAPETSRIRLQQVHVCEIDFEKKFEKMETATIADTAFVHLNEHAEIWRMEYLLIEHLLP